MKLRASYKIVFLCLTLFALFASHLNHSAAQSTNAELETINPDSLEFKHQLDLSQIFKAVKKHDPKPQAHQLQNPKTKKLVLVGTLIMGRQKLAWLRIDEQIHQLEIGQMVPGFNAQISRIESESVVITRSKQCNKIHQCDRVIAIGDRLF